MGYKDRSTMVPNSFTGRPNVSNTDPMYRVKATEVNANFSAVTLGIAITQALGGECVDNGSAAAVCKLKLPYGRMAAGDRVVIVEDRPTARTWSVLATAGMSTEQIEFDDTDLHDVATAGTADYNTIQADLLIYDIVQQDQAYIPAQALLKGLEFGLDGTDIPWKDGEVDTIEDKFNSLVGIATPGGADKAVQFNDGGVFGGETDFVYDKVMKSIAVGATPIASGQYSAALGGASPHALGTQSAVVAGEGGVASGGGAIVLAGFYNEAVAQDTVASGSYAQATRKGERAHNGIVQMLVPVAGIVGTHDIEIGLDTADAFPYVLEIDPIGVPGTYFIYEDGKTYHWRAYVTGRTAAGVSKAWKCEGLAEMTGGVSRDVAAPLVTLVAQEFGSIPWTLAVATNVPGNSLDFTVQDPGGATIRWYCHLEWEQVAL